MSPAETAAPWCPLPTWHPSCCHDLARAVEPERTFLRQIDVRDDYDLVVQHDWLSAPGGFR